MLSVTTSSPRLFEDDFVILRSISGFDKIQLSKVTHFKAYDQMTIAFFENGNKKVYMHTLKSIQHALNKHSFFRCHKSYMINLSKIVAFNKSSRSISLAHTKEYVYVARRRKKELMQEISQNLQNQNLNLL